MAQKKARKPAPREVVSLRLPALLREELIREAAKRKIKLSEEIERRLTHYDELIADANQIDDAILGASLNTHLDDMVDKLAERIVALNSERKMIDKLAEHFAAAMKKKPGVKSE